MQTYNYLYIRQQSVNIANLNHCFRPSGTRTHAPVQSSTIYSIVNIHHSIMHTLHPCLKPIRRCVTGPLDAAKLTLTMDMTALGEGPGLNRKDTCRYIGPIGLSCMEVTIENQGCLLQGLPFEEICWQCAGVLERLALKPSRYPGTLWLGSILFHWTSKQRPIYTGIHSNTYRYCQELHTEMSATIMSRCKQSWVTNIPQRLPAWAQ